MATFCWPLDLVEHVQFWSSPDPLGLKLDICYGMILNLLSTAYFHITILNRTAWFDIYKNISLIFIIFQGIFIRSRNRIKQDFFSSLDICEHVSPVQVI